MFPNPLIRNINAGDLFESFLVAAIASVLGIRLYLELTHYPQIGGTTFHIAHLLFGGFFMMGALILLFAYLNRPIMYASAILGGIGFGTFIDELGKFITRDNNYFYEPTAALIYVIFIALFLLFRRFEQNTRLSKKEYLMNALERMEDVVFQDLDAREKRQVEQLLAKCEETDPIVIALKKALQEAEVIKSQSTFQTARHRIYRLYKQLIRNPWFARGAVVFFLGKSALAILAAFGFIVTLVNTHGYIEASRHSFAQIGELLSSTLATLYVVIGAFLIYRSRYNAYQMFRRSLLISIFFTQFFVFYREQFSAVLLLFFNILILVVLQYMIEQEKDTKDS